MKIAIVTDSTSDIPVDIADRYGITIIPNYLTINNITTLDQTGVSRQDFYASLEDTKILPTTAAPSPEVYTRTYQELIESGMDAVISLHPSHLLSAILNSASLGARPFGNTIHLWDSGTASLGLGFQALHAATEAAKGNDLPDILNHIEEIRNKVRVFALLDTLAYVRHSGRVHWVTASLGSMLGLKAVIELRDGLVHRRGLARTRAQALRLLTNVAQSMGAIRDAAILHTSPLVESEAECVREALAIDAGNILTVPITPIIGSHVGPHCVGVALVLK